MIKKLLARLLPPKNHFHGGLHITPPRHKNMSTGTPSREAALSAEYAISLRQRDGSAYLAKVAPGARVLRGQLLAEPVNSQDAPVHAPTSGTIRAIEPRPEMHPANLPVPHLILDSDGKDEAVPPLPALDIETASADELRERIAACGIVGLGGAGFPTARKLGHPANTLVINAAECEPYITCDDLQIRENAADIIRGAQIAAKILGAAHIYFGIEDDKPQAIAALERAAADIADPRLKISSVPTRYPSGNARQLFELLLGVRVPADQHASDYGLICHNSGTLKAVYDAVIRGEPLTERYTTISGEGVNQPQVLRIRTGAPAHDLIAQAGGEKGDNRYIIGGPMMGYEIASADTPLQKTGNSLLLLPAIEPAEESPCIRCSRCADACPMELLPQQLLWYSQSDEHKRLKQYRLFDCIECGICAAVCPSAIPLVQYYRHSKGAIRAADEKARAAEHARTRHEARTARLEREAAERQAQMDARRAKLQQNPAADKPERYTPGKTATVTPADFPPPPMGQGWGSSANLAAESSTDDKTATIEAAKARAAARRAERLAQNGEAPKEQLPPLQGASAPAAGEGWGGGSVPASSANIETTTDIAPASPDDAKTATIEAAKARAAARKAARLAQNSEAETPTAAASPAEQPLSPWERGWGEGEKNEDKEPAPHQLPPDDGKTAAIEVAKARAAARKAARLAQQPLNEEASAQNPPTPPHPSSAGGGSASMAEALTVAETSAEPPPPPQRSAAGEGRGGGSVPAFSANIETTTDTALAPHQLPPDDAKTAAIEVAKARAAARKAARIAQNSEAETPTAVASPAEQPLSPWERGWGEGEKNEDKEPAPHQLPPDDGKTAAIEVAKARAAARKAARLAQQPLNEEASAQNPPTPPHPSPAGGGSASMAETPTGQPITLPQTEEQAETSMTPPDNDDKTTRDAKLAAARAKSEERRIAHAKLKQHMRDTAIPIRPQSDEQK
ncbi:electron transport complex subunit RsxC [Cardiobacterium hominis]|uniref:electron transport complex subunit RsxC n=1 Tax=Cardiobacterium hominis TaxID=2718 RepID=UPI0028E3812D|nr:electron transport complex subunit RsxC [Cardiobacterium hominis]